MRTCILTLLCLLAWTGQVCSEPSHKPIKWRELKPGLSFARLEATRYVRLGEPYVAAVRVDPERFRFDLAHARQEPEGQGRNIEEWQEHTGAMVAFNPGQYDKRGVHLGLFVSHGRNWGTNLLKAWKGVFAAEPRRSDLPKAVIVDMLHSHFDMAETSYTQVMQSLMLVDANGRKRVQNTDNKANRTALAIDRHGRAMILCSEGAFTLWDFASFIQESELGLVQAMNLDGGQASQLAVQVNGFRYVNYGQWFSSELGSLVLLGYRSPLPGVVTVFPRQAQR